MSELSSSEAADVVVMLGTRWATLERHVTRWRAVIRRWTDDVRIRSVRVVDYPSLSLRNLTRAHASPLESWDPDVSGVAGRVVLWRRRTPLDGVAWRATGRAVGAALPPTGERRVVIAATPLWVPALRHVGADRIAFDAVDDWRALPSVARVREHVEAGYRATAGLDSASAVSSELADRLGHDYGTVAVAIPNGVELSRFLGTPSPPPGGTPDAPFAAYVGVIQERVDLDLLRAAREVMPVVVAGPASGATVAELIDSKVTYLGPLSEQLVTGLLRAAAVGLVPHRIDALTTSMDPMKLREYLAAGLPVVTTSASSATAGTARVLVAHDARAFADAVAHARELGPLHAPDPGVEHRTWATVADELLAVHVSPTTSRGGGPTQP